MCPLKFPIQIFFGTTYISHAAKFHSTTEFTHASVCYTEGEGERGGEGKVEGKGFLRKKEGGGKDKKEMGCS